MDRSRKLLQVEQDNSLQVLKQGDPQGQMIFNTYQSDIDPESPGKDFPVDFPAFPGEFQGFLGDLPDLPDEFLDFPGDFPDFPGYLMGFLLSLIHI